MALLVNEISITLGVTRSIGKYEFARVDVTSRATIDPCAPDSKEYRMAHKELLGGVESMLERIEGQVIEAQEELSAKMAKGK